MPVDAKVPAATAAKLARLRSESQALADRARLAAGAGETFKASILMREKNAVDAEVSKMAPRGLFDRIRMLFTPKSKKLVPPAAPIQLYSFSRGTAVGHPAALDGLGFTAAAFANASAAQPAYAGQPQASTAWGSILGAGRSILVGAADTARERTLTELQKLAEAGKGKTKVAPTQGPVAPAATPALSPGLVLGVGVAAVAAVYYFSSRR